MNFEVEVGSVPYVAVLLQGSTAPVQSAGTPALSGKLRWCRLGPRPAAGPLHRFCTDEPAVPEEEESWQSCRRPRTFLRSLGTHMLDAPLQSTHAVLANAYPDNSHILMI